MRMLRQSPDLPGPNFVTMFDPGPNAPCAKVRRRPIGRSSVSISHVPTIVIIGAGFSGAATAAQLLRQAVGAHLRIVLINESGRMARGLAYGTHSAQHVLNVPAGNMSALADDPDNFVRYCRWSDPLVAPGDFVPRRFYGAYLEALLGAAEFSGETSVSLDRVVGRVQAVRVLPGSDRCRVELSDATSIEADHVVLAFGHFPPTDPLPAGVSDMLGQRYIRDPWKPEALAAIRPHDDVLLLGTGLTAVDVALVLARGDRTGRLIAISRRGLRPQPHRESSKAHGAIDTPTLREQMSGTLRQQLRSFRRALRAHQERDGDWRDMVGALRPFTPAIWQSWSDSERSRFLRHLRPYWDAARHRCAPTAHATFESLQRDGVLHLDAARIVDVRTGQRGVDVVMRRRGSPSPISEHVQHVINCTGPSSDLKHCRSALVAGLLSEGRVVPDKLGLGLKVSAQGALIDARGQASSLLSYIGPLLRARDWEATAVPELRAHAQHLACRLTAKFGSASEKAGTPGR